MKRRITTAVVALMAIGGVAGAGSALAAGNEQSGPTVGDCISDGVYGNEPNRADGAPGGPQEQEPGTNGGNIVPTQSPGPFTNNPNDPENPTPGRSVGDYHREYGPGAVPEACRTATQ